MTSSLTYADAWAVVDDRGLDICTVSGTRLDSITLWLIKNITSDLSGEADIEYLWQRYGLNTGRATVHKVGVKVKAEQ